MFAVKYIATTLGRMALIMIALCILASIVTGCASFPVAGVACYAGMATIVPSQISMCEDVEPVVTKNWSGK